MEKRKGFIKEVTNGKSCLPSKAQKQYVEDIVVQKRKMPKPKQGHFVRRTAALLLAFGLIASLLSGRATAQDWSTQEARAAWMIGLYRGESIGPNAKFGAAAALARFALNPEDAEVISSITHYYDKVPAGKNGEQFSYPGIAYVLGKYWDKFTPAQLDHLKTRIKGFSDILGHGTENHAIMKCVAAYLFSQYWPNETGWAGGQYSSEQVAQVSRARILQVVNSLYDKNHDEYLCPGYTSIHIFPYHALYNCATDPEIKDAAYAALCYFSASLAANSLNGILIPPYARASTGSAASPGPDGFGGGTSFLPWLYLGSGYTSKVPNATSVLKWDPYSICAYAAVSDFVPPPAILSLWRGETAPYELTSSSAGFGHHGTSPGFWGTGEPGAKTRYIYRHRDYAVGSGFIEYYPDEYHCDENSSLSILYRSSGNDKFSVVEAHHPYWYSNNRVWRTSNSPFMQTAQHKSAAIALFNIPVADPWVGRGRPGDWPAKRNNHFNNLIQEAFVRYPKSIDQKTEAKDWIFLREGGVYIAIRPLKAYTIDTNFPNVEEFDVVVSAFAKTGFVFDVSTNQEFATFEAFQKAIHQNPITVDWEALSVTYTSLAGDKITATWNPPNYSGPPQTSWVWNPVEASLELEGNGEYLINWDQQV